MTEIGVRELRDGLSRHLAQVREGATLTVTDHGHPIARLVPFTRRSVLEELIAEGVARRPHRAKQASPEPVTISSTVSDLVSNQRR
ncbi:prevent-host-death family protein [Quadrisphaera granulorum]|uniref:Antitoxin n=1 Tax=Quadrisphaera granulorum TaxID=317664 RepID=A0A316ABY1_9ACTN|nr:type II toxin-antitoxin system prevent-host-death family antitoxin [Quadrisphaera granulorum]PWJ55092.1 prevent-host-death family protein [Quadrisphaera granulorum]SZE95601.1 prevent-host-death family protein [Quadrisphaera granulorum]